MLVVDDEESIRSLVEMTLEGAGFLVHTEEHGFEIERVVHSFRPDVAVLDVWLPGSPDGFTLARRMQCLTAVPILFLTGADTLEDRLAGFEAGASDYLIKPFEPKELVARVRALLRLAGRPSSGIRQIGEVLIDEDSRTVAVAGPSVELTAIEFDLLLALAKRPGRVISKKQLLEMVWGYDEYDTHLVEVHMSRLRQKLGPTASRLIRTVRGGGYVIGP